MIAVVLLSFGVFALTFLAEPSAVGRLRTGLLVIGGGAAVLGLAAGALAVWMLARRPRQAGVDEKLS